MAQPPFQELHLLTEPPAGGTEAEFVLRRGGLCRIVQ